MTLSSSLRAENHAHRIKFILFDVDGVLADGGIWIFPASAQSNSTADHAKQLAHRKSFNSYRSL